MQAALIGDTIESAVLCTALADSFGEVQCGAIQADQCVKVCIEDISKEEQYGLKHEKNYKNFLRL